VRPFPIFAFLFLVTPLIELYFLIKVGESIGAWKTVFLVIFTAFTGVWLLRQQGLSTLGRFQKSMMEGKAPAGEMLEGVFLLLGGGLLLIPGFVTDFIGLLCLLPFSRQYFAKWLLRRSSFPRGTVMGGFSHGQASVDEHIIDGEFVSKDTDRLR